jgi:hypothetical protein
MNPLPPHDHPELHPLDLELLRSDPRALAMELAETQIGYSNHRARGDDPAQEHRYERLMHLLGIAMGYLLSAPEPGSIVVHREPEHLRAELGALHGLAHAVRMALQKPDAAADDALAMELVVRLEAVDAIMKGRA